MREGKQQQIIIVILLAIMFGGASLTNFGTSDEPLDPIISIIRFSMISVSLLGLLLMSDSGILKIHIKPLPLNFIWLAFSIMVLFSGLANEQITVIRDGFWFMIVVPVVFFNAVPKLMSKYGNVLITLGLLLGTSPYIIVSLIFDPVWHSDSVIYSGIFPNSNQFGFTVAVMSASFFVLAIGTLVNRKSFLETFSINISLVTCFLMILISNARTSLIAFFCMSVFMIWKILQKPINIIISFVIAFILSASTSSFVEDYSWLAARVSEIQVKDSLSGRNDIWFKTIDDMELLGHGDQYFEDNFGLGAHNTIIHILGVNGILSVILIVLFTIMTFYYAGGYLKRNREKDSYAIAPLVFMTCFWILSMGEGMFGSLGNAMTLAYLLSTGIIISDLNIEKDYS